MWTRWRAGLRLLPASAGKYRNPALVSTSASYVSSAGGDEPGTEERKIRSMVETACVETEAVMVQFDKLAKGFQSSQTAIQTAINLEKPLMTNL
jgi:hypothetical protein